MDRSLILGLVSLVFNLLLGTTLVAVLRYRIQNRSADKTDFTAVTEELRKQRDEAFEHIRSQDERLARMEVEIQGLRIARDLDPFPHWLVDLSGVFTFVNRPFEQNFLEPSGQTYRDIVGKPNSALWPQKFCDAIKLLDAAARKRPDGIARANTTLDVPLTGPSEITIHKLPVRVRGVIVAYAGYITSIDPVMDKIGWPQTATRPPLDA